MAPIRQSIVREFLHVGANASTTAEKGRALEDLICYVFETVPGVAVSRRNEKNAFATEEIDVALWNDCDPAGFFFSTEHNPCRVQELVR